MSLARSGSAADYLRRGKVRLENRQYLDAIKYFRLAVLKSEGDTRAESYLYRGIVYARLGLHFNAINDCTAAIEIAPTCWDAYYYRGMVYASGDQYCSEAKADLECVSSQFEPESPQGKKIKFTLDRLDKLAKASCIPSAREPVPMKYASVSEYLNEAKETREQKKTFELSRWDLDQYFALVYYNKALDLDPDCAKAHYEIGNIYYQRKEYQKAIECYFKAISKEADLDPQELRMAYFYSGHGYCHLAEKEEEKERNSVMADETFTKAYKCYTEVISLNPLDQAAYYWRRQTIKARVNLSLAISDYSKAIDLEDEKSAESIEIKRDASDELIDVLGKRSTKKIFDAIKKIEDEPHRIHLLKKCLNKNDKELGKRFGQDSLNLFASKTSAQKEIQGYLVDLAKAKINKKRQDIFSSIDSLSPEAFSLIFSDGNLYCMGEESLAGENKAFQALCRSAKEQLEREAAAAIQSAEKSYTVENEQKMEGVKTHLEQWLNDKKRFLTEKLSCDPLKTVHDLFGQLASYMPPELLKANKDMVSKIPVNQMEGYIAQLQDQLEDYQRSVALEEKAPEGAEQAEARQAVLQENISAALAKLRLLEGSETLADAYENANNATRSVYKLNQQISGLPQVEEENKRLEKLDRDVRADLDCAIKRNSDALLKKAEGLLARYINNRRCYELEEYDDYARTVDANISNPRFAEKKEKFLDWVNLMSKELLIKCFEMEYPLLCKKIKVSLDLRACSTAKTQDLQRYDEYHQSCNDLLADFNKRGLEAFSLKTLEACCNAKIGELNAFCTGQRDVLTRENKACQEWLTKQYEEREAAHFDRLQHPKNPARDRMIQQKAHDDAASRAKSDAAKSLGRTAGLGGLFDPRSSENKSVSTPNGGKIGDTELPLYRTFKRPGE